MKRIFRFLKAIIKYILFGKVLDNKTIQKRISICNSCELYDKTHDKCEKCGCYIHFKCILNTEICPINKW